MTVSFEVSKSREFQSVRFGLSEEIALTDEDDRDAVVKTARLRLFKEVTDTAGKAFDHILARQEKTAGGSSGSFPCRSPLVFQDRVPESGVPTTLEPRRFPLVAFPPHTHFLHHVPGADVVGVASGNHAVQAERMKKLNDGEFVHGTLYQAGRGQCSKWRRTAFGS